MHFGRFLLNPPTLETTHEKDDCSCDSRICVAKITVPLSDQDCSPLGRMAKEIKALIGASVGKVGAGSKLVE